MLLMRRAKTHPWGTTSPVEFEVSYEDENPAEAAFNRPDSK